MTPALQASITTILLWIYYSSLILLFEAEFTKAYVESRGSRRSLAKGWRAVENVGARTL